jgi:hypothetical protein
LNERRKEADPPVDLSHTIWATSRNALLSGANACSVVPLERMGARWYFAHQTRY